MILQFAQTQVRAFSEEAVRRVLKENGVSEYSVSELLKKEEQSAVEEKKKPVSSFRAFRKNQEKYSDSASQPKEHQERAFLSFRLFVEYKTWRLFIDCLVSFPNWQKSFPCKEKKRDSTP